MKMKTFVILLFAVMFSTTILSSSLLNQVYYKPEKIFQAALPVQVLQTSEDSTNPSKLKAMLKGSIYETGENMTVFGACFDGYGYLIVDETLNATLTSWYPNGTVWEQDAQMTAVVNGSGNQTGRWLYTINMGTQMGTYLTEITCRYQGDTANAYGEWQNPDWVKRIATFQNESAQYYNNLTTQITTFSNSVQSNFSSILNILSNISNASGSGSGSGNINTTQLNYQFADLYNAIKSIDPAYWVPYTGYPFVSGQMAGYTGVTVDAISPSDIYVGYSSTNEVYYWDGYTWSNLTISGGVTRVNDVSVVAALTPYAYIGTDNGYSKNGAGAALIPGGGSNDLVSIKAFQGNPAESIRIYAVASDGKVWLSTDDAATWANIHNFTSGVATTYGGISDILWYDNAGQNNYRVMISSGTDNYMLYYDGSTYQQISGSGYTLGESVLFTSTSGYVINGSVVFSFNGTGLTQVFNITTTGSRLYTIDGVSANDVWVGGDSTVGFYHYNGVNWQHSNYPYSAGIIIGVNEQANLSNILDISMVNGKTGYAISDSGTLLRLYSGYDSKFDDILSQLANISINLTPITDYLDQMNITLSEVNAIVVSINGTVYEMNATLGNVYTVVNYMNATLYEVNNTLYLVNASLDTIQTSINTINTTVNGINSTVTTIQNSLLNINTTLVSQINANITTILNQINANTSAVMNQINLNTTALMSQMNSNVTMLYEAINALIIGNGNTLYFWNNTSPVNSSYTVMNLTIPAVSNQMNTSFVMLGVGDYELVRRLFDGTIIRLRSGQYRQHTSVYYAAGDRTVQLHSVLYNYNSTNGELTQLGSSGLSTPLTPGAYQDVDFYGAVPQDYVFVPGDYLVMALNATITGGTIDSNVTLVVGGITGAGITIGSDILNVEDGIDLTPIINSIAQMEYNLNNSLYYNFTYIQQQISNLNNSMVANFSAMSQQMVDLNATLQANMTTLIANQTYMQLYLETTLFPIMNATYQNTLNILAQVGIIQQNVNTTMTIVNETQQQVINISTGVDELVNKSRRIRAWITV